MSEDVRLLRFEDGDVSDEILLSDEVRYIPLQLTFEHWEDHGNDDGQGMVVIFTLVSLQRITKKVTAMLSHIASFYFIFWSKNGPKREI